MTEQSCCFTGYRPNKFPFPLDRGSSDYIHFENKLTDAIFSLPNEGITRFYTGMAMGFDLIAAETVLLLRESIQNCSVELICALPFEGQAQTFSTDWKRRYDRVLAAADEIVLLGKEYYSGCYNKRNRYMVDHSGTVITYFDGQRGGTMSTLHYAGRLGRRIVNLAEYGVHEYFDEDYETYELVEDDLF